MFGKVEKAVYDKVVKERDDAKAALETKTGENEILTGQVDTLTTERDQARTDLATAKTTITNLEGQVNTLTEKLAGRPGAEATNVKPEAETIETEEKVTVEMDPVVQYAQEKM